MLKYPLICLIVLLFAAGCARPPLVELESVRGVVDHAYASGAARFAPGEYQLANSAMIAAEQLVRTGEYSKALRTLELARRYSSEALSITLERKNQIAREQKLLADLKRQEELRQEEERQRLEAEQQRRRRELAEQRATELKQVAVEEQRKKRVVAVVPKKPDPVKPQRVDRIRVTPGDNLATIAARVDVYEDPLLWPLIYRANRDQIKDPKEIFAGQVLIIPRDKDQEEIETARQEARELDLF